MLGLRTRAQPFTRKLFCAAAVTVQLLAAINLAGIHYNCRAIKFDGQTNGTARIRLRRGFKFSANHGE